MLKDYLLNNNKINKIINEDNLLIKNSFNDFNITLTALDFMNNNKSIFVVLPNLYNAQKYYDEIVNIVNEDDVLFYPADELITAQMLISSGDFKIERINTINTLIKTNQKRIIITHLNGAMKYQLPKKIWLNNIINLKVNDVINVDKLLSNFITLGYEHTYTISKPGEFSKRGSIIDIYPLNYDKPVRLDFFDEELDTIRSFDVETQRSVDKLSTVTIIPITELMYDQDQLEIATSKFNEFLNKSQLSEQENDKFRNDLNKLINRQSLDVLGSYIDFFTDNKYSIFDFVENKKIYLIDKDGMDVIYEGIRSDLDNYCSSLGGYSLIDLKYFMNIEKLYNYTHSHIANKDKYKNINEVNIFVKEAPKFLAKEKQLILDLKVILKSKMVVVCIKNQTRLDKFKNSCLDNGLTYIITRNQRDFKHNTINIIDEYYPSFELVEENFIYLNEKSIFNISNEQKKAKYKSVFSNATKINRHDELQIGDFVVHYDHGIGKYLGLKTMEVDKVKRDYVHVSYEGNDALYIPLEQINSIQKYSLAETKSVKLSTLGNPTWAKMKAKIRKRVSELKDKLIALYARRQKSVGYSFLPDSTEQVLFEADFLHQLTEDQEKAVMEVKEDMESSKPMDRLVCGDVGFGKTEVALRACFKAVNNAKQVAVLAPTTILSRQHYHTFKDRMEKFGVNVELLNRFVPLKKQKEIFARLADGTVDVVIGTHRLLSKDVIYKDLGLLIIDEEQRFGVTHKERIKEIKINIDTINLSATPIPRTLQMSILGIKDLSMIETPPKNRYPVQTYVTELNDSIVKEAILREMARDGQVFYLYNNTCNIEEVVYKIKELVPEAKVTYAHGKMSKDRLEDVISSFIDNEYDVLVCTTIIETGIDIPNANTLLIHDATRLGLGQMYQIRGRVGRSNKIAYAYFMYDGTKKITEQAEERLLAIKELNELGSGYKIAMRDLSIRGAGDLLGEDQSGFVESVGIEMYLKILEEELANNENNSPENIPKQDKSLAKVYTNKYISNDYINNEDVKIQIHKKIDTLKTMNDLSLLTEELKDRFGYLNEEINIYMYEKLFKNLCNDLNIYKIEHNNRNQVVLNMTEQQTNKADGNKMFQLATSISKEIKLTYFNKEIQIIITKDSNNDWIKIYVNYLQALKCNNLSKLG